MAKRKVVDVLGKKREENHLMIHNVPNRLKQRFKAACHISGHTMAHVIKSFMQKFGDIHIPPEG